MPDPPATGETETCETVGVLAPAIAAVTAFQSAEALKILAGATSAVTRGILMLDVWDHEHVLRMTDAGPSPRCSTCARQSFPALEADWSGSVTLCGRDAVQVQPRGGGRVQLDALAQSLAAAVEDLELAPHLLRFAVEGCRFSVFPGGRALIFGIADQGRARILYDRYVGA
jgi:adenylyltransferase/sulfurtransferase